MSYMTQRHKKPEKIYPLEEANDRLLDIFHNHGFTDYPHEKRQQLAQFYQLLMTRQKTDNFTRLIKFRDIAIKHFIDCLMIPRLTDLQFPLLDIGSGPGFPGIPLKIEFPDERIILAEGVKKRVDFLKVVREEMHLQNLDIVGRNVDENFVLPVQGAITRAVADMSITLRQISKALQVGGVVYFMKGPNVDEELLLTKAQWRPYFELIQDTAYTLPNTQNQRRLICWRKVQEVPQ